MANNKKDKRIHFTRKICSGDFFRPCYWGGQRGMALISALLIGFIILSLVLAWMAIILTREKEAVLEQNRTQARYLAISGLAKAKYHIVKNDSVFNPNSQEPQKIEEKLFLEGGDCVMEAGREAGYYKITSTGRYKGASQKVTAYYGLNADSACPYALLVNDSRGVILEPGSAVKGDIASPQAPQDRDGGWRGNHLQGLSLPQVNAQSFENYIAYCQSLLANPHRAGVELFSPQNFGPGSVLPDKGIIFVNDNVLIYNGHSDSTFKLAGPKVIISTADIQVSGWVKLENVTLIAAGKVSILDNALAGHCALFSYQSVDVRDDASFSGLVFSLMDVNVGGNASVKPGSVIYASGQPGGKINISDNARVRAAVISAGADTTCCIHITGEASVEGLVFSLNRVEVEGVVLGTVMAGRLYKPFSDPENNKLSGTIDRKGLKPAQAVPLLFNIGLKPGWLVEIGKNESILPDHSSKEKPLTEGK
jgi:hypothetical protein